MKQGETFWRTRHAYTIVFLILCCLLITACASGGGSASSRSPNVDGASSCPPIPYNQRPVVGIMDFRNRTGEAISQGQVNSIVDMLGEKMCHFQRVVLVERDRFDAIYKEAGLTAGQLLDPANLARFGNALGADLLVVGSITQYELTVVSGEPVGTAIKKEGQTCERETDAKAKGRRVVVKEKEAKKGSVLGDLIPSFQVEIATVRIVARIIDVATGRALVYACGYGKESVPSVGVRVETDKFTPAQEIAVTHIAADLACKVTPDMKKQLPTDTTSF